MAHSIRLPYGTGRLSFDLPSPPVVLAPSEPEKTANEQRFRQALDDFFGAHPPDLKQPLVVVGDKTRLCGYPRFLPVLLETLTDWGAAPEKIRLLIAYGTHAAQGEAESRQAYGETYARWAWEHHRCDATGLFRELGRTERGTPVRLRADLVEAGFVATFGAISHHYFAGYGGGRKLIFPGLGEKQAIYANHGLFLDRAGRCLAAGCQPGRLEGNPLAEDLEDYAAFRPADLAVHGLLDSHGQVCDLLVGRGREHFLEACRRHARCFETAAERVDCVLASCGGHPKDINFIQSHKALHHAADFVRDGGRLILLARCPDGVGSQTFLPWFGEGGRDAAFDRLAADYVGNGGTALAMMAKSARINIALVTELDQAVTETIGCERITADQARDMVSGCGGSLAVIPNASMLVRATGI
ncbi:MAG: lactate racemase domain-containing protein [Desulfosarcinaceae bacterium]